MIRAAPQSGSLRVTVPATVLIAVRNDIHWSATAEGGEGFNVWSYTGKLPEGLSLSDDGVLHGRLEQSAVWDLTLKVQDQMTDATDTAKIHFIAEFAEGTQPQVETTRLPLARAGEPFSVSLAATGGVGRYQWTIKDLLPPGLKLEAGTISGVPEARLSGTWRLAVAVTDEIGQSSAPVRLDLVVAPSWPPPRIATEFLSTGIVGDEYRQQLGAESCWGRCTWEAERLPPGLSLTRQWLQGVPGKAGTFKLKLKVADTRGHSTSREMDLIVKPRQSKSADRAP